MARPTHEDAEDYVRSHYGLDESDDDQFQQMVDWTYGQMSEEEPED